MYSSSWPLTQKPNKSLLVKKSAYKHFCHDIQIGFKVGYAQKHLCK